MARIKQGVFSWEDVLAQRYQNNKPAPLALKVIRAQQKQADTDTHPHVDSDTDTDALIDASTPPTECELQSQKSHLLSKLSPELRLMIWEMVLAWSRLHIIQRPGRRLGHIICPGAPSCEICQDGLPQPVKDGGRGVSLTLMWTDKITNNKGRNRNGGKGNGSKLLALPMTCRQIYTESIHLLYTHNTFEFSNTWTLPYLLPTIPNSHWTRIRSVELRWAFPGHWLPSKDPVKAVYFSAGRQQWIETCAALKQMDSLRSFTLSLAGNWFCEPVEKIPVFLDPLRNLRLRGGGAWSLVLPGQPYYIEEVGRIKEWLRGRGVNCVIWFG